MAVIDFSDAALEARTRVETMHALAVPDEMRVSDMNELQHRPMARLRTLQQRPVSPGDSIRLWSESRPMFSDLTQDFRILPEPQEEAI